MFLKELMRVEEYHVYLVQYQARLIQLQRQLGEYDANMHLDFSLSDIYELLIAHQVPSISTRLLLLLPIVNHNKSVDQTFTFPMK